MTRLRHLAALAVAAGSIAAAPVLVPNRATYEVSLAQAKPGGAVGARGRTVIEITGTCDGWQTVERFLLDTSDSDGQVSRSDFVITAWENRAGTSMRFDVTDMTDGTIGERNKGRAELAADGSGTVTLIAPAASSFALPASTLFPMAQTLEILRAAEAGKTILSGPVFQGGDETSLYYSTVTIGRPLGLADPAREAPDGATDLLSGVAAWPVVMGYYPSGKDGLTPDYEVVTRLYANGIAGTMSLIYPDFTLKATLTRLERLPMPKC